MRGGQVLKTAAVIFPMLAGAAMAAGPAAAALKYPYRLAVDQNSGSLYIADPLSGVSVYNPVSNALAPFFAASNAFSLAVNKNGLVYIGIVGANSQISVYNPQGQSINTLSVPPGDSPITMTFDSDNVLYQSNGNVGNQPAFVEINAYTSDLSFSYSARVLPYNQLQSYTLAV